MPFAAPRPCISSPTCPHPAVYKGKCQEHARGAERQRYNADTRKWYATKDWQVLRAITLERDPVCVECRTAASTEVDHIRPHRGDRALFFERTNLQGMCHTCHGRKTARGE